MWVSVAQVSKHVLGDVGGNTLGRENVAVSGSGVGIVSDQGKPQSLKLRPVPKEKYARLILDTRINDHVIVAIKDFESIGFVIKSATNTKENCSEFILGIHPGFNRSNNQGCDRSNQCANDTRNQITEGVVHINLLVRIAGAVAKVPRGRGSGWLGCSLLSIYYPP
jgi:hypothetical protein